MLSVPLVKAIQQFVFEKYSLKNTDLPCGICNSIQLINISENILCADKTKQQVCSKVLKDLKVEGTSAVQLSTLGTPMKVDLQPQKQPSSNSQLSVNDVLTMHTQLQVSLTDSFCKF